MSGIQPSYGLPPLGRGTIHQNHGEVPPPLVGAAICMVEDQVFVYGGRHVNSSRMMCDLYVLDLRIYVWRRYRYAEDARPSARYFHQMSRWKDYVVVYGGMAVCEKTGPVAALNDIAFLSLDTLQWQVYTAEETQLPGLPVPRGGYAHISAVSANKLFVLGGQDAKNNYLEEISVFALDSRKWIHVEPFSKTLGAYRSAVTAEMMDLGELETDLSALKMFKPITYEPAPGFRKATSRASDSATESKPSSSSQVLKESREISFEAFSPLYIYSNYNFNDAASVQRELILATPLDESGLRLESKTSEMHGIILPPGLRFPQLSSLGEILFLSGVHLSAEQQEFSVWILNLESMQWKPLTSPDREHLQRGSWNWGCVNRAREIYIIFGNADRALAEDYGERRLNFDDTFVIDIGACGLSSLTSSKYMQCMPCLGLGQTILAEQVFCDMEILTFDQVRLPCLSKLLVARWPQFARLVKGYDNWSQNQDGPPQSPLSMGSTSTQTSVHTSSIKQVSFYTYYLAYPRKVCIALLHYLYTGQLDEETRKKHDIMASLLHLANMDGTLPHLRHILVCQLVELIDKNNASTMYAVAAMADDATLLRASALALHD